MSESREAAAVPGPTSAGPLPRPTTSAAPPLRPMTSALPIQPNCCLTPGGKAVPDAASPSELAGLGKWSEAAPEAASRGGDYRVHARNAAAMWEALAKGHGALLVGTDEVRVVAPSPYHALRAIVLDPETNRPATIASIVDTVHGESGLHRRVVEDPSGTLDLNCYDLEPRLRMTVMARPPAPLPPDHDEPPAAGAAPERWETPHGQGREPPGQERPGRELPGQERSGQERSGQERSGQERSGQERSGRERSGQEWPGGEAAPGIRVVMATTPKHVATAELILISIFPPPRSGADPRGRILPARVLGIDGWRVWLGYRDGVPAGATYTYHDGSSLGMYQVGTLSEHRGHGVARALVRTILGAYPHDTVTLTATDQGRPLYQALGFEALSCAVWWRPNHTGDDSGQGLR